MSVIPSDLVFYGCASMPEADGATVGGAVDFTKRIDFSDISPAGFMDLVSSSASDTATKCIYSGRDSTGVPVSVTTTLNGQTPVLGAQNLGRVLSALLSSASSAFGLTTPGGTTAVGDVLLYAHTAVISTHTAQAGAANKTGTTPALMKLQSGDGASVAVGQCIRTTGGTGANQIRKIIAASGYGTDFVGVNRDWGTLPDATTTYVVVEGLLFEILPNPVTAITRLFANTSADIPGGSSRSFYEKFFVVNNNTTVALTPTSPNTGVAIQISADTPALPSGVLLDVGPATTFNDSVTIANRQTAPAGISFVTQPANIIAPSPGNLAPGAAPNTAGALGVWARETVPAGAAPYNGAATIQATGNTI
jgi:hypothetical protein